MLIIEGTAAAPGLAAGPLFRLLARSSGERRAGAVDSERHTFNSAVAVSAAALSELMESAADDDAEGILAFQLALLEDDEIFEPVSEAIADGVAADQAWTQVMNTLVADYESSDDSYFRGRATDLKDLRDRVCAAITGEDEQPIPTGVIVVADDLAPSRFLAVNWTGGGIALKNAGTTSHVAILARARGVPMIVGVSVDALYDSAEVLLDAEYGRLIVNPDLPAREVFETRQRQLQARTDHESRYLSQEARSADGERIHVMINIAGPSDLHGLEVQHVDGIGLVRTEFLFHERDRLPDEEEQYRVYQEIVTWAQGKPVTLRTLDAGGDKPVRGITHDGESNPFLGVRGVRLSLEHTSVLSTQLRAMVRAAAHGALKIMVPMVTVPQELMQVRALTQTIARELGLPVPEVGMMIEVPAAAIAIEEFGSSFYSIGSNDLLQYLMAVSRDEPRLSALSLPGTAFWRVVAHVCDQGKRTGKDVSLCGDLASEARWIPQLLAAGLRTLSVAPAALAAVKAEIHRTRVHG